MTLTDIAAKLGIFDSKISEHEAQIAELNKAKAAVSTEAENLKAENSKLQADLATAKQTISTIQGDKAKLEADAKAAQEALAATEKEMPTKIAAEAAKIMAGLGYKQPIGGTPADNQPQKSLAKQLDEIPDARARAEFWEKHKAEINQGK